MKVLEFKHRELNRSMLGRVTTCLYLSLSKWEIILVRLAKGAILTLELLENLTTQLRAIMEE